MALKLTKSNDRDDYHYFSSDRKVTVQIGRSTNVPQYVWTIFHPDIKCAIWGEESSSLEEAKIAADSWIKQWVRDST